MLFDTYSFLGPMMHCVRWGLWPSREERFGGQTPGPYLQLLIYDSPGDRTDQWHWIHILPNFFHPCWH